MTLVLPAAPTVGSSFAQGLGTGVANALPQSISELIHGRAKQKQISQILGINPQNQQSPDLDVDQEADTSSLMGKIGMPSRSAKSPGLDLTPEKIIAMHSVDPQLANTMAGLYKGQEKAKAMEQESADQQRIAQDSFNRMSEIVNRGNLGRTSKVVGQFPGQTAEDVGEFESLGGALEALLVDKVSRGTLSNARFKYITETLLPKSSDLESTIKGKLKAIAKELDLDPSALGVKSERSSSSTGHVLMRSPDGRTVSVPKDKANAAIKAGGKLVK